eukprot:767009-Hanusia_phi.AAC.6
MLIDPAPTRLAKAHLGIYGFLDGLSLLSLLLCCLLPRPAHSCLAPIPHPCALPSCSRHHFPLLVPSRSSPCSHNCSKAPSSITPTLSLQTRSGLPVPSPHPSHSDWQDGRQVCTAPIVPQTAVGTSYSLKQAPVPSQNKFPSSPPPAGRLLGRGGRLLLIGDYHMRGLEGDVGTRVELASCPTLFLV